MELLAEKLNIRNFLWNARVAYKIIRGIKKFNAE